MFGFPNPVNEKAARVVAGGVLLLSALTLTLSLAVSSKWLWLSVMLAYGFFARVLTGPTLSPLGQLATRVIAPRLGPAKLVAGPPKRFAQSIGLVVTATTVVFVAVGLAGAAEILLGVMVVFATLESVFGLCVGCKIFGALMSAGLIPAATCEACANISLRAAH